MKRKDIEKSHNYSEHFIEFCGSAPLSTDDNVVAIQFLSNKITPAIIGEAESDGNNTKMTVGSFPKMVHECTIYLSRDKLQMLKETIEHAIERTDEE